jgi:uncharacterized surface protein with fasciclin (FAS1) repeats
MISLKTRSATAAVALVATAGLAIGACSSSSDSASKSKETTTTAASMAAERSPSTADKTIVEIAAGNPDFSTLVSAVKAAGLAETLSGAGPYTVFAPTNEAFAKLPPETLQSLLLPENKDKLAAILTYHVVPAKVMAADVTAGPVKTVNGAEFTVSTDGGVKITDGQGNVANVVKTDIEASNGVIHVIDTVLLPPM